MRYYFGLDEVARVRYNARVHDTVIEAVCPLTYTLGPADVLQAKHHALAVVRRKSLWMSTLHASDLVLLAWDSR
jgi:hypothetical protein